MEPRDAAAQGSGFSVLDGAALVVGAAVTSLHFRDLPMRTLTPFGWGLLWFLFCGVALTAAGPEIYVVRCHVRRLANYPTVGDRLWALLGLPWLLTAPLHPFRAPRGAASTPGNDPLLYGPALWLLICAACLVALAVIWRTWVMAPRRLPAEGTAPRTWTERVGLGLAIAWPLQCGFGLVLGE